MQASDVTLAVMNYNGRAFLEVILPSLAAQTAQGFHLVLVDDGSTDDSLAYVAEHWPGVAVDTSDRGNLGTTHTMARAVARCRTPYLSILNNDLELDPRWLGELMAELEAHPEAAAVDAKMLAFDKRDVIDGVRDLLRRNGYPGRRGQFELDRGQYDEPCEVFSVSGACALYRLSALRDAGSYDTDYFAYYEDVDWGFRARLRSHAQRVVPKAVAYHLGSATQARKPGRYDHLLVRNQIVTVVKNMPGSLLLRWGPRMAFFQLKWLAFDTRHRRGRAHVRGLLGALAALPGALRKRRAIQRGRRASAAEIARHID